MRKVLPLRSLFHGPSRMSSPLSLGQLAGVPFEIMHPTMEKDTTYTKIFVGGLPYHTSDASLRKYFETFGDIDEAVVITDKQTGKSRGYGFVSSFVFFSVFLIWGFCSVKCCRSFEKNLKPSFFLFLDSLDCHFNLWQVFLALQASLAVTLFSQNPHVECRLMSVPCLRHEEQVLS